MLHASRNVPLPVYYLVLYVRMQVRTSIEILLNTLHQVDYVRRTVCPLYADGPTYVGHTPTNVGPLRDLPPSGSPILIIVFLTFYLVTPH